MENVEEKLNHALGIPDERYESLYEMVQDAVFEDLEGKVTDVFSKIQPRIVSDDELILCGFIAGSLLTLAKEHPQIVLEYKLKKMANGMG